jgi:SAM-dependent methyltransferase
MRSRPQPTCYACGGSGELLYTGQPDRVFFAGGTWSVRRCRTAACGLLWLDPMPLEEDLHLAYRDYYTHGETTKSGGHRIGAAVYGAVTNALLAVAGIPQEQARIQRMFLGTGDGRKLLDVGCGSGGFLSRMRELGWDASGIDVDRAAVAIARSRYGVDAQYGTAADLVAQGRRFDVVAANHVIEHVVDPVRFLVHCRQLLRGEGRVILVTPNAQSFGHRRFGQYWRGLEVPRHLWVFTPDALGRCAQRAGLAQSAVFTSSANAARLVGVSRSIERHGRYDERGRSRGERMAEWLSRPVTALHARVRLLLDRGSGEEICAILRPRGSGPEASPGST